PAVPVMVTVVDPTVAVPDAAKMTMLLVPVVVVVVGLKVAVTPVGNALVLNVMALAKPLRRVMVTVLVPLAPCATLTVVGLAARLKSGEPGTVNEIVTLCESVPLVPVTVMVEVVCAAVFETASVKTLLVPVVVVGFGLKLAVTPVGTPVVENVI